MDGKAEDLGDVNGSLLYIGDTNYLYSKEEHYTGKKLPKVVVNNFSFIRNQAQGGNGSDGSGGGLGTGGGITLLAGDLTVTDAIFQGLDAKGGTGGDGVKGGDGAVRRDLLSVSSQTRGKPGGNGGVSSIPYRNNKFGEVEYGKFAAPGGTGGAAGRGGKVCMGSSGDHAGEPGGRGSSTSEFGFGGGGGGAGGGGAWRYDKGAGISLCAVIPQLFVYKGGAGGRGGAGGKHGGDGATGGRGAEAIAIGLFASANAPSPTTGSRGSAGKKKGDSIAIWTDSASELSGQELTSKLTLDNVSFYNTNLGAGEIRDEIFSDSSKRNSIFINSVFTGPNRRGRAEVQPGKKKSDPDMQQLALPSNQVPIVSGISAPRVPDVADISDVVLKGTDLADQFLVSYEDRSTVAGIRTDLTDPNNALNQIWQELDSFIKEVTK